MLTDSRDRILASIGGRTRELELVLQLDIDFTTLERAANDRTTGCRGALGRANRRLRGRERAVVNVPTLRHLRVALCPMWHPTPSGLVVKPLSEADPHSLGAQINPKTGPRYQNKTVSLNKL